MKANRYNAVLPCPACANGDCQLCSESGNFAYYAPAHPGEQDRDVLIYHADRDDDGAAEKHMMNAQRFDALAGSATMQPPTDDNGNLSVKQDIADRMQNQLGKNAPYDGGPAETDMPNGWPADPDMSAQEVMAWLRSRGDQLLADRLEQAVGHYNSETN